ncbi:MAG: hypothetical protein RL223_5130 [Pseudomonadota bacterium]|jgi:glyoxylate utilization-related uncharacterized protein
MSPAPVNTHTMPWEQLPVPELDALLPAKTCLMDPDTGMAIWKIRYPAGFTTISHWHRCAHGMYVLEGQLLTSAGEIGPGGFVWFPEGTVMHHGAREDNDVIFLFITNKAFDIHFTHLEGLPPGDAAAQTFATP